MIRFTCHEYRHFSINFSQRGGGGGRQFAWRTHLDLPLNLANFPPKFFIHAFEGQL